MSVLRGFDANDGGGHVQALSHLSQLNCAVWLFTVSQIDY